MKRVLIGLSAISILLSGCVSPLVRPNPPAWQDKATNAANWQRFARRTVSAIPRSSQSMQPVYVAAAPNGAPYADIYRSYLQEELVAAGYPVVQDPSGDAITLDVKANWVVYRPFGSKRLVEYSSFGSAGLLLAMATRNISRLDTALGAGAALGPLLDLADALNGATDAEVVLTSVITIPNDNHLHFIHTETFYVRPSDVPLYKGSIDRPPPTPAPAEVSLQVVER